MSAPVAPARLAAWAGSRVRPSIAAFAVVCAVIAFALVWSLRPVASEPLPAMTTYTTRAELAVKAREVTRGDAPAGELQSVMDFVGLRIEPRTAGDSRDTLRFTFDEPIRVKGVLVSVDIAQMPLVEVVVGIDNRDPYGTTATAWLIHASDANDGTHSKIDEHVMFEDGFRVEPGQFVGVGAWLWNDSTEDRQVFPEVIVYYEWLPGR